MAHGFDHTSRATGEQDFEVGGRTVKACRVFTAFGEVLTTEPDSDPNGCCSGDEISRVEVEVRAGTRCDICEEVINPRRKQAKGGE